MERRDQFVAIVVSAVVVIFVVAWLTGREKGNGESQVNSPERHRVQTLASHSGESRAVELKSLEPSAEVLLEISLVDSSTGEAVTDGGVLARVESSKRALTMPVTRVSGGEFILTSADIEEAFEAATGADASASSAKRRPDAGNLERGSLGKEEPSGAEKESAGPLKKVRLQISAPGYLCYHLGFEESELRRAYTVELVPVASLQVIVTSNEKRLEGVTVKLLAPSWSFSHELVPLDGGAVRRVDDCQVGATSESGVVLFSDLPPGSGYAIEAEGQEFLASGGVENIHLEPGSEEVVEVLLPPGGTLSGRIVDCSGNAGSGFAVVCKRRVRRATLIEASCESDELGRFELAGLSTGLKLLRFERRKGDVWEFFASSAVVFAGQNTDCGVLSADSLASGAGQVDGAVLLEGLPVPGADVRIWAGINERDDWELRLSTGETGMFQACGVAPGPLWVSAAKVLEGARWFGEVSTQLSEHEATRVDIVLQPPWKKSKPGGHLDLTLRDPRGEVIQARQQPDFDVFLFKADGSALAAGFRCVGDEVSCLRIGPVPPGRYTARVFCSAGIATVRECVVNDGLQSRYDAFLQEPPVLKGCVVDPDGNPLRARIFRRVAVDERDTPLGVVGDIVSAPDGTFAVALFERGEAGSLSVTCAGYEGRTLEVTGSEADLGDIVLTQR